MTLQEKVIATAYTGTAFVTGNELSTFYEYVYEKFGTIYTHEMASKEFWVKLKEKSKEDFINMLSEGGRQ